ncbi:MAG: type I restriction-modification system subunit M [bacterium]|nr:type I restriction-modification system subunit M [bacterium]
MANVKEHERAELHKAIWGIADALRGSVSGWEFKAYVLGTLFYRFISEKLETSVNLSEQKAGNKGFVYGDLDDRTALPAKRQIVDKLGYFISPSHLFRNVYAAAERNRNLNVTLSDVFEEIEGSARGTESEQDFKGLFNGMNFNSTQNLGATVDERNDRLRDLLKGVAQMKLGDFKSNTIDAFGDAYEYLMKMYASFAGKSGGEFFTPQEASRLLALITTQGKAKVNKVYDPACGSGSLLMQVAKVIGKDKVLGGFFGQEKEPTIHQLCRMNMFLHDIDPRKFDIALGDTLKKPNERHLDEEPFEVVVSNPPYSIHWDGDSDPTLITDPRFAPAGVLAPRTKADFAFILHALAWLAENGCAAIVCFPGIFYRGGAEQKIRQYLVENNFVDALIDLPPNLFFGTSIATTILVLRKNKKNDNNVLFIDAKEQFVKEGNKNRLADENIAAIFKLYADRREVKHLTRLVPSTQIAAEGYNLSVSTYVEPRDTRPKVDIRQINARIAEIVAREDKLRKAVEKTIRELGE